MLNRVSLFDSPLNGIQETSSPVSKIDIAPDNETGGTLAAILSRVKRYRLRNGLTLLLLEDHSAPVVTVQFWVRTGSRNERPGITGISHLFEHMMFRGSRKYGPEEHANLVKRNGGVLNAGTSFDHTVYYETIASDRIELVIHLEAERFANLRIQSEILNEEKRVVGEERRQRTDNNVYGSAGEQLLTACYRSSPYAWPIVGWMHDIKNYSLNDVQEYYRLRYAPNNITGVVVGDFRTEPVLRLMRKYWGAIPKQPTPPPPLMEEVELRGERRITYKYPAEIPMIFAAFLIPPKDHPDRAALTMLARIFSEGQSSRLFQRLVYHDQLALFAEGDIVPLIGPGLFLFHIGLKPTVTHEQGETALWQEIERVRENSVSADELEKAKNQIETEIVSLLTTTAGIAAALGEYETDSGDYRRFAAFIDSIPRVTDDDVIRVARKYLHPDRRTVVTVVPVNGQSKGADR